MRKLILVIMFITLISTVVFSEPSLVEQIQNLYLIQNKINNNIQTKEQRMTDVEKLKDKISRGVCVQEDVLIGVEDRNEMLDRYTLEISRVNREITDMENKLKYTDNLIDTYNRILNSDNTTMTDLIKGYLSLSYKQPSGTNFTMPLDKIRVTSKYGMRNHPIFRKQMMHTGIDLAGDLGDSLYAVENGTVIRTANNQAQGNIVVLMHSDGYFTLYAHIRNNGTLVKTGDTVTRGQKIAEVGSTGFSTGPHLHFELYAKGVRVNPENYIKFR